MVNILGYHENDPVKSYGESKISSIFYYIVMVGCGGNGGYAVQRIAKMMNAFSGVSSFLMLADPDTVEEKNLLRQPFIGTDIGKKKADVLAKRYGGSYGLKIGSYSDTYIESVEQLESLFSHTDYLKTRDKHLQKVLIGAVDNDFSRKIMNDFFQKSDDLIYIDAGIEGVFLPRGNREPDEWTDEERQEHIESGYSGQVVVGVKKKGSVILPPLDEVYPINAKDAIPPSHSCGIEPYQPQRMISNENAALQISTVMNELFASDNILVHVVNFNSRTGNCRPTYVEDVIPGQEATIDSVYSGGEGEELSDKVEGADDELDAELVEFREDVKEPAAADGESEVRTLELELEPVDLALIENLYKVSDLSDSSKPEVYDAIVKYADETLNVNLLEWRCHNLQVSIVDRDGKTYLVATDIPKTEESGIPA
ncbi:ThiF family adenylyltransferase [Paenibacillus alkaliterrae]|uniref:ThiF family adenylyltransferase n=1 Tax=Paenibacillus alkaliterrae TaxID=320909 RepID=UPI001F485902|nr:ThiF family adenylyltransferase [Paenibacillus alkaliterrae]MCF2940624.1 ThiF family adenylyltransferase [Paenibacillus alkaliterrae]